MQNSPESEERHEPDQGSEETGGVAQAERKDAAAQLAEMEDRWKRALADLDNYRKRSASEATRRVGEAREAMLLQWLDAVDSVERAIAMQPEPENPIAQGLRAVLEQMESILDRQGVQRLGAPGDRFDPERHEAIGVRETDDAPDRTILEVARSGFALGDRVLRPAQVIVSRAPAGDG
ncbi:MAG: molecular chaperone GrpE [Thermoleophilaceae bacterium]|jgi:molecular chaperone GrpE|nr:molecular chaperone GrpE [Thermoleophilaceae bacterium]